MSRKDAVKQTAQDLNLPKNAVYEAALQSESQINQPIGILNEIITQEDLDEIVVKMLNFFMGYGELFENIEKMLVNYSYRFDAYFHKFTSKQYEYLLLKDDLEKIVNKYHKLIKKQVKKCLDYIEKHDVNFSL
jgi:hypothetical protein